MIKRASSTEELSVGARIALARERHGLSQNQLAKYLDKTRAAVSQYEKNMIMPRPKVFDALAKFFNADPEWFEHGRGKAPDPFDAQITIPEINVAKLTEKVADLSALGVGRAKWELPASSFRFIVDAQHRIVAARAPNDVGPIQEGDGVLIDAAQRRRAEGVFLVVDRTQGPQLRQYHSDSKADGAWVVGRAVARFHML